MLDRCQQRKVQMHFTRLKCKLVWFDVLTSRLFCCRWPWRWPSRSDARVARRTRSVTTVNAAVVSSHMMTSSLPNKLQRHHLCERCQRRMTSSWRERCVATKTEVVIRVCDVTSGVKSCRNLKMRDSGEISAVFWCFKDFNVLTETKASMCSKNMCRAISFYHCVLPLIFRQFFVIKAGCYRSSVAALCYFRTILTFITVWILK